MLKRVAQLPRKSRLNIGTEELETFLAIAELGSFSKAAERLALSQPSISNRMQRLERAVHARLFERTTRTVVLTPAGERLRGKVEPILRDLQAVLDEFQEDAEARGQQVTVATTPMLAAILMPAVIQRFAKSDPAIKINVDDNVTAQLPSEIRARRIDFALLAREAASFPGLVYEKFITDHFMLVGPKGHEALADGTATTMDLTRYPLFVLTAYKEKISEIGLRLAAQNLTLSPINSVTNVPTLLGFVGAGLGLTLLPSIILRAGGVIDDTRFCMATLTDVTLTRDFGIHTLPNATLSPAARLFRQALRSNMVDYTHSLGVKTKLRPL